MRPQSIRVFERLYLVSVLLSILGGVWTWFHWSDVLPAGTPPQAAAMMPAIIGGGLLFGIILNLLLWFFIARRGAEIAKWIFVVLFALGLAGVVRSLFGGGAVLPGPMRIISIVQMLLQAGCTWMLFRPDSKPWFVPGARR